MQTHEPQNRSKMNRNEKRESEALWTVRQSAAFLGYADGTVRNLISSGRLGPRVKLATGATRIPSEAVRAFAYGRTAEAKGQD